MFFRASGKFFFFELLVRALFRLGTIASSTEAKPSKRCSFFEPAYQFPSFSKFVHVRNWPLLIEIGDDSPFRSTSQRFVLKVTQPFFVPDVR